MTTIDNVPRVEPDGLPVLDAGPWALEKYDRVWYYDCLFTKAMREVIDDLVYIDLFSGPGYAELRDRNETVLGSPLLALEAPYGFDRYIFCEKDLKRMEALKERVEREHPHADVRFVPGDVNTKVGEIVDHIPSHGPDRKVLSFCFSDPNDLSPRFETLRRLTEGRRMDVMSILPVAMDGRRNFYSQYVQEGSDKIAGFLGDPDWRDHWTEAELRGERKIARFLARRYVRSMVGINYLEPDLTNFHTVKADQLTLYLIGFFSKHPLAYEFWSDARDYTAGQYGLGLPS